MDYERRGRNSHGEEWRGEEASRYRDSSREMREREKTITMNYWPRSMNERKTWEGERVKLLVAF